MLVDGSWLVAKGRLLRPTRLGPWSRDVLVRDRVVTVVRLIITGPRWWA